MACLHMEEAFNIFTNLFLTTYIAGLGLGVPLAVIIIILIVLLIMRTTDNKTLPTR